MGDPTDNTNELDSYGVWVKRPPQDCAADTESAHPDLSEFSAASEAADGGIPDADAFPVPDGNSFDVPAERAAADGGSDEFQVEDFMSDSSFSMDGAADGEISLDDFMGGSSDEPSFGGDSGEISLDDFLGDGAFSSGGAEKEDDIADDEPLDIEIAFNESEEDAVPTEPVADEDEDEYAGDEEASEFDDMFGTMAEEPKKQPDPEADAAALQQLMGNTEDISLDDFGLDESDDATAAAAAASINAAAESKSTESVDLSDFGIDSDAAETPVTSNVKESARKRVVDYDLAITDDDMVQAAPVADEIKSEEKSEQEQHTENTTVNNTLLEKIIEDLSGLKDEINALKNDFAELKANGAAAPACTGPQDAARTEESGSFFGEAGSDADTALSGDELNSIANTAAFTEEAPEAAASEDAADAPNAALMEASVEEIAVVEEDEAMEIPDAVTDEDLFEPLPEAADCAEPEAAEEDLGGGGTAPAGEESAAETEAGDEEPDSGLKIDFDNEILEEPDLDEIGADFGGLQEIPDEISVPKAEAEAEEDVLPADDILEGSAELEAAVAPEATDAGSADEEDVLPADDILEDSAELEAAAEPEGASAEEDGTPAGSMEALPAGDADAEDDMFIEPQIAAEMQVEEEAADSAIPEDGASDGPQDISADVPADELPAEEEAGAVEEPDFEAPPVPADDFSEAPAAEAAEAMDGGLDDLIGEEPDVAEEISDESLDYLNEDRPVETEELAGEGRSDRTQDCSLPSDLKADVKSVLLYMDQLLENLPEEKIMEFAKSEQFATYKKLFSELGLS